MKGITVAAAAALIAGAQAAIDPIVIKGSKFFHKNSGEQFFMKGIAYQRTSPKLAASIRPLTPCRGDQHQYDANRDYQIHRSPRRR